MIPALLILLAICITFLITDYRRHEEIKNIRALYETEMDMLSTWSYERGYKDCDKQLPMTKPFAPDRSDA